MSKTTAQHEREFVDARLAAGPDLHTVPTSALERELTERRLAANYVYDRPTRRWLPGPHAERLFIDEPDRP